MTLLFIAAITTSDKIEIAGIIASLITSIVAIVISVITLLQNSKMIEESSRPYISIYGSAVHIASPDYYLIVKNFGQSSAFITSFTYDFDLKDCARNCAVNEPFSNIEHSTMVPGQAFKALIDYQKTTRQTDTINFHIEYSSGHKHYEEDICVNLKGNLGNLQLHHTNKGKELLTISEALEDMNIRSL